MTAASGDLGRRALAAHLAQRVAEPALAILGYQELIVEEVRETGPRGALPDLESVLSAARNLCLLIERLMASDADAAEAEAGLEARLRHDLRTPMNAILGYSEMVLEEFAEAVPERLRGDIARVVEEARVLLLRIDDIVGFSTAEAGHGPSDALDASIAASVARAVSVRPAGPPNEPGRILVIDDTASSREVLAKRLRRQRHEVVTADSAKAALALLEDGRFDLVLADILMPDMNGIDLLARLKADGRWRDIPVIMVSGLKDEDAVVRCIEAGAEDYLTKPVDPVLLRARVEASLERGRWREREKRYLAEIEMERDRADRLLHAILPAQVVRRLAGGETVIADHVERATILFADIVNFTELASRTPPAELVRWLGALFARFDSLADEHRVEKIKTIGDAYMAACGLLEPRDDHARAVLGFGRAMLCEMAEASSLEPALDLRIGIHSGPVVAGVLGRKRFIYDIWGHTVNLASRLESHGIPGRIQISGSTLAALGDPPVAVCERELEIRGVGRATVYVVD